MFVEAAELFFLDSYGHLSKSLYACCALADVQEKHGLTSWRDADGGPLIELFSKWFKPNLLPPGVYWWGWWGTAEYDGNQEARVFALLLMSEILRDLQRAKRKARS